ncbi:MAG TPA: VTT domain-containing protein [Clostridia bacterium]|nr:VTT domain-containing protein [Clostridia bacterium]
MLPDFDLVQITKTFGYAGLFFMVFAESGLFFGFFLPGDSLLFTAGFLASQGFFNIYVLVPLLMVAAIGGDNAGYWMGEKFGNWLMKQKESFFFRKKNMLKAQKFYEKHGGKALVIARFIPAVRTFVPITAGIAKMHYKTFFFFNVAGGILWAFGMSIAGYFLGSLIPDVDKYLLPIIAAIILLSITPGVIHLLKERKGEEDDEILEIGEAIAEKLGEEEKEKKKPKKKE